MSLQLEKISIEFSFRKTAKKGIEITLISEDLGSLLDSIDHNELQTYNYKLYQALHFSGYHRQNNLLSDDGKIPNLQFLNNFDEIVIKRIKNVFTNREIRTYVKLFHEYLILLKEYKENES